MPSSAGKPRPPTRHHQDIVGNTSYFDGHQGRTIPVPDDNMMSWPDSSSPTILLTEERGNFFEDASPASAAQPTWVCRAAQGSDAVQGRSSTCARGQTHAPIEPPFHTATGITASKFGDISVAGDTQPPGQTSVQSTSFNSFEYNFDHASAGGAGEVTSATYETWETSQNMSTNIYASTTDLLMQNLSVVVGNPSARCYANAPWRAFCWMCAYLAEFTQQGAMGHGQGCCSNLVGTQRTCGHQDTPRTPGALAQA